MNKVILGFFAVFGTPQVPPKNNFLWNFFLSWNQEFLKVTGTTFVLGPKIWFDPKRQFSKKHGFWPTFPQYLYIIGVVSVRLWPPRGYFGVCRGYFGVCRGYFGLCWGYFGICWGYFGIYQGFFGVCWGTLGYVRAHEIFLPSWMSTLPSAGARLRPREARPLG